MMDENHEKNIISPVRQKQIEIVQEVDRLCKLHELTYYIVAGTLLGAVRHKGYIPWDDDIDIAMPRKDLLKFREICSRELSSKFFLQCKDTDPIYWQSFDKMLMNGTLFATESKIKVNVHHGIFIDIFPLDDSFDRDTWLGRRMLAFQKKWVMTANTIRQDRSGFKKVEGTKWKIICTVSRIFSIRTISTVTELVMRMKCIGKVKYYTNLSSNYSWMKQTMPKEVYGTPVYLPFEYESFPAPAQWNEFLTRLYGPDYMELPPEEKRINHSIHYIKVENDEK